MKHNSEKNGTKASRALGRRALLKAVGLGAVMGLAPATARALEKGDVDGKGRELATLFDLRKCIACGECVYACREVNQDQFPEPVSPIPQPVPAGRAKIEDWSHKRDVADRLTPYNWLYIQTAEGNWQGEDFQIHIPRRCLHCANPACANLCPFGAAAKQANGIVRIQPDICMGGAKCRKVCPWHIPQRQSGVGLYLKLMDRYAGNGVMYKCHRCFARVEQGELPACIEVCPENVQSIGPRDEILARARELADEMDGYIYGLHENGGTNTIYVSPVPFEVLNQAVAKGPGRPHLAETGNPMAAEEGLSWAVYAAPVVGALAGLAKAGRRLLARNAADRGGDHG